MTLDQITHSNTDESVRLLAEYTIAPRRIAELLACVENQARNLGSHLVTWQEMVVADPAGLMRPAGEIVEEGRAHIRNRMKEMLRARRRRMARQTTVADR